MNKQQDIDKKVNEALESLDGIQRAEPGTWFFTRVQNRLRRDEQNVWESTGRFLSRPVIAIAGLFLVLSLNIFILVGKETPNTTPQGITSTPDEESILTAVTSFDYENLEP
jgi:hypothetical protein